jgi:riboflavin synthase
MFTGIITELGIVHSISNRGDNNVVTLQAPQSAKEIEIGHSIAVNGACLTVIAIHNDLITVEAVKETLMRTTLSKLHPGKKVNLELPMRINDMLHGHIVQGHIDTIGEIHSIKNLTWSTVLTIKFPLEYNRYLIEKGSVAVDGISLTVVEVGEDRFTVSIIPHTAENTNIKYLRSTEGVNLEFDVLARYIEKNISGNNRGITADFLKEHGF